MQISVRPWHELDLGEIARLTCVAKGADEGTSEAEAMRSMVISKSKPLNMFFCICSM